MPDYIPKVYYARTAWRCIGWSPALSAFVGVREIAGAFTVEAWNPQDTNSRVTVPESRELQRHGEAAILSLFARLIGGIQ